MGNWVNAPNQNHEEAANREKRENMQLPHREKRGKKRMKQGGGEKKGMKTRSPWARKRPVPVIGAR